MVEALCWKALPVSVMNGEGVTGKTDGETGSKNRSGVKGSWASHDSDIQPWLSPAGCVVEAAAAAAPSLNRSGAAGPSGLSNAGSGLRAAKFLTASCFCRDLKPASSSAKEQTAGPFPQSTLASCPCGQVSRAAGMLCRARAGSGAAGGSPAQAGSYPCAAVGGEQLTSSCGAVALWHPTCAEMLSYVQQLLHAVSGARKRCQKTEVTALTPARSRCSRSLSSSELSF